MKVKLLLFLLGILPFLQVKAQSDTTLSGKMDSIRTGKLFGGMGQYKSFSIGINGGITSQAIFLGGPTDFQNNKISFGYGVSLRKQFSHVFGLQLDANGGRVSGTNDAGSTLQSYNTNFIQGTLNGVISTGGISLLHHKNAVSFFAKAGMGLAFYKPKTTSTGGAETDFKPNGSIKELVIPVGAGAKVRLSEAAALNLGYTINFIDGDNFDGWKRANPTKDSYAYAYAGLEFTLGAGSKKNIDWVNPVQQTYDQLYDESLHKEVEALKNRVREVENAVADLKKDSDGDGVTDQFDKCPNTPAGALIDGSGCAVVIAPTASAEENPDVYKDVLFDKNDNIIPERNYGQLDMLSGNIRNDGVKVILNGYASPDEKQQAGKSTAARRKRQAQLQVELSTQRANLIKKYLVASGSDPKNIRVKGYGTARPVADNAAEEGRKLNRRVEIKQE